jgi:hypothetical protein
MGVFVSHRPSFWQRARRRGRTGYPLWLELSVTLLLKLFLLWALTLLLPTKLSHEQAAQGVAERLRSDAAPLSTPSTKDAP